MHVATKIFQDPCQDETLTSDPLVLWIPRDELGVAEDEIVYTRETYNSIGISCDGASLSAQGNLILGGQPPDWRLKGSEVGISIRNASPRHVMFGPSVSIASNDLEMSYPESVRGDRLFSFKQYVCVVTGGRTGIGLMATQALIANGARVYIIEKRERYGVDLLVTAAGSEGERSTAPKMDAKELQQMLFAEDQMKWISTFNTNVSAMYFTTVAFLPLLQKCSSDGHAKASVIVVASMSGLKSHLSGYFSNSASKAATVHLSKMMAYEFKDFNVRVNCIAPGYFPSNDKEEGTAHKGRPSKEQTLLDPAGEKKWTESEIAQGVLFLAKNRSVTGEVLNIDNGEFLRNPVH
ncbi:hypothetical protein V499_01177 [Pseudogymnoascus sp. VKM F-103]|nr:hypothetical protein V499_01177 [Pseudogymnoascus sp. VKM F-103]